MTAPLEQLQSAAPVKAAHHALAGVEGGAYVVGGTVRDALLERPLRDIDLVVSGPVEEAARTIGRVLRGPVFRLSEAFGAWRVLDRERRFTFDLSPMQGESIAADLARRDFTVNAMAVPLGGGELLDPHGGRADASAGVLRVLGESAYRDDPLRALRLARLSAELGLVPDAETERLTGAAAAAVTQASPERVFAELRRLVVAPGVLEGLALADRTGLVAAVLPELAALHGVEQSHFHHLDVHGHTLEVLRQQIALEHDLGSAFGDQAGRLGAVLDEPLGDDLTRAQALRFGALLHDIGKPATCRVRPDGRVTFIGHDSAGEEIIGAICRRLRTSARLEDYLRALTRNHLVLGFLVRERPLSRELVYRYLTACQPVEVEVTVLSCADRLATRGRNAERAIAAHLELARELMAEALEWRTAGPPKPAVNGRVLTREAGIPPGPELGAVLQRLAEARFTGEAATREEALALARRFHDPARAE